VVCALKLLPEYRELLVGRRTIHFAPELVLGEYFRRNSRSYVTADLLRDDVDLRVDMTRMASIPDGSFNCCVACDVLEHVEDDHAALRELHRILDTSGVAIITVPQKDNAATTYEDPTITAAEARTRAFGQFDHVRIYGADVVDRIHSAGFRVVTIDDSYFSPSDRARFVLRPPVLSAHPLATNYRKVFICHRD
jgi:SAM-dependent methyltransferase